jgi:hypothetical protein
VANKVALRNWSVSWDRRMEGWEDGVGLGVCLNATGGTEMSCLLRELNLDCPARRPSPATMPNELSQLPVPTERNLERPRERRSLQQAAK